MEASYPNEQESDLMARHDKKCINTTQTSDTTVENLDGETSRCISLHSASFYSVVRDSSKNVIVNVHDGESERSDRLRALFEDLSQMNRASDVILANYIVELQSKLCKQLKIVQLPAVVIYTKTNKAGVVCDCDGDEFIADSTALATLINNTVVGQELFFVKDTSILMSNDEEVEAAGVESSVVHDINSKAMNSAETSSKQNSLLTDKNTEHSSSGDVVLAAEEKRCFLTTSTEPHIHDDCNDLDGAVRTST
jgi:arabinogalactan endo-1,4-beta-galactosidase